MTCRHQPGDTSCSSHPYNVEARQYEYEAEQEKQRKMDKQLTEEIALLRARQKEIDSKTPDAERYEIVEVQDIGNHIVLKVKYPNCAKCAFEGTKVMVFLDINWKDVLKWRRIDPHFRPPLRDVTASEKFKSNIQEAPSPAARFPGNKEGWEDALDYARKKAGK